MNKPRIAADPGLPSHRVTDACVPLDLGAFSSEVGTGSREENASEQKARAPFRLHRNGKGSRVVVVGTAFRSKSRERVYGADKVWSGEHSIWNYTEI
jgi:hypothetical protein